ncbi:hypothetical protein GGQ74_000917 [Desulfobaculum xiamenense]|uniref:Uncharacterized protein n=1 Tax=Desulfobaculum xiamenense TaxID=995050 RepID=A0A846QJK7_9BACT|nr:hypothetical protein [Desulfobaculum xiamenense]NJB67277.1 hypothetical protein [Desulfobaculum xiamenense]
MPTKLVVTKMLQCEVCGETFSRSYDQCPKCGSEDFTGYRMVNPIARLPMELILTVAAHLTWLLGSAGCIAFLWNTDTPDPHTNLLLAFAGFGFLLLSLILSIALFGIAELLGRTIRIQRRVKAFVEDYWSQSD